MAHQLGCSCGSMTWTIDENAAGRHIACYCVDCQAAQHHLGTAGDGLDAAGGTYLLQTVPNSIKITKGHDHLALLRLSPKGLLRWHAGCCGTPIANTLANPKFAFAGAVLPPKDDRFGKVRAKVNTIGARTPVKDYGTLSAILSLLGRAALGRISGAYRPSPFFDAAGTPTASAVILSRKERLAVTPG